MNWCLVFHHGLAWSHYASGQTTWRKTQSCIQLFQILVWLLALLMANVLTSWLCMSWSNLTSLNMDQAFLHRQQTFNWGITCRILLMQNFQGLTTARTGIGEGNVMLNAMPNPFLLNKYVKIKNRKTAMATNWSSCKSWMAFSNFL